MTWFDLLVILLIAVYALLGYRSGLIRRVIGFIGLYGGLYVAGYTGHAALPVFRQGFPFVEPADGRIYLFFGAWVLIVVLVEVVATLYNQEVQVSLVALNHTSGAFVGALTGFIAAVLAWIILGAASNPLGGSLTATEVHLRGQISGSYLGPKILKPATGAIQATFSPVLPHNLDTYFGGAGSNP